MVFPDKLFVFLFLFLFLLEKYTLFEYFLHGFLSSTFTLLFVSSSSVFFVSFVLYTLIISSFIPNFCNPYLLKRDVWICFVLFFDGKIEIEDDFNSGEISSIICCFFFGNSFIDFCFILLLSIVSILFAFEGELFLSLKLLVFALVFVYS